MNSLLLKQAGAIALGAINLTLLVWALVTHRRRQSLPEGYYKLLTASVIVTGLQVGLGVSFVLGGKAVKGMHLFYGTVVTAGSAGQAMLGRRTSLGQRYRGKPLVYAFFSLLVMLVTVRTWMSA